LLAKAGVSMHFGFEVEKLEPRAGGWAAVASDGRTLATAPVVVLANARDAVRLAPIADLTLRSVRGQVSHLPAAGFPAIGAVLLRGGFALPPVEGMVVTGATYDIGEDDPHPRTDGHAGNLARLARVLPGAERGIDPALLDGRVGFRAVAPDRLPVVGPLPDREGLYAAFAYASRGILWCCLMAELLASRIEEEPWPVEARLAQAVAPSRFARRARRRG
jgi:tRNA 5-methylaminomethyl-2-thiouridine biosynthesis bifunctional protein